MMGCFASTLSTVAAAAFALGACATEQSWDEPDDPTWTNVNALRCVMALEQNNNYLNKPGHHDIDPQFPEACGGGGGGGGNAKPTKPEITSLENANCLPITISWSESSDSNGIGSYRVYRYDGTNLDIFSTNSAETASRTYVDTSAIAGTSYKYQVLAVDGLGLAGDLGAEHWSSSCLGVGGQVAYSGPLATPATSINAVAAGDTVDHYYAGINAGNLVVTRIDDDSTEKWNVTATGGASEARAIAFDKGAGVVYVVGWYAGSVTISGTNMPDTTLPTPAVGDPQDIFVLRIDVGGPEIGFTYAAYSSCFNDACNDVGWRSDSAETVAVDSNHYVYVGGYAGNDFTPYNSKQGSAQSAVQQTTENFTAPVGIIFALEFVGGSLSPLDSAVHLGVTSGSTNVKVTGLALDEVNNADCYGPCLAVAGTFTGELMTGITSTSENVFVGVYRYPSNDSPDYLKWMKGGGDGGIEPDAAQRANAVAFNATGDTVWVTGDFDGRLDFGSTDPNIPAMSTTGQTIYMAGLDAIGGIPVAQRSFAMTAAAGNSTGNGLTVGGVIALTGKMGTTTDFGGGPLAGNNSGFVAVFDEAALVARSPTPLKFARASADAPAAGNAVVLDPSGDVRVGGAVTGTTSNFGLAPLVTGGFVARFVQ